MANIKSKKRTQVSAIDWAEVSKDIEQQDSMKLTEAEKELKQAIAKLKASGLDRSDEELLEVKKAVER